MVVGLSTFRLNMKRVRSASGRRFIVLPPELEAKLQAAKATVLSWEPDRDALAALDRAIGRTTVLVGKRQRSRRPPRR
jgi:hypothetical protein